MKILGKLKAIDWDRVIDRSATIAGTTAVVFGLLWVIVVLYFFAEPQWNHLLQGLFLLACGAWNLYTVSQHQLAETAYHERSYDLLIKLAELEAAAGRTEVRDGIVPALMERLERRMGTEGDES